jgi:hypothetical protein
MLSGIPVTELFYPETISQELIGDFSRNMSILF